MEYGDQSDICLWKIINSLAILWLRKPLKTSTRLAGDGIWIRDLSNASLVRYHGATSLGNHSLCNMQKNKFSLNTWKLYRILSILNFSIYLEVQVKKYMVQNTPNKVFKWALDFVSAQLILQHFRHSSFSNPSVALPTSQLILQPFRCFTYVTVHSPTLLSLLLRHKLRHLASRPCNGGLM